MPDAKKLRRKVLLNVLASPLTALPFVAGITALVGSWAIGVRPDLGLLAGMAGLLGSVGVFYTKLFIGGEGHAKQALDELEEESQAKRDHVLDDLEHQLEADGDPRTQAALRDLRALARAFEELRNNEAFRGSTGSVFDIVSGVQQLFDQCVHSLERTLALIHTAKQLRTKAACEPIRIQREHILDDVGRSIRKLGQILAAVEGLDMGEGADSELVRIGAELDQHLAVAQQVEQRVRAFDRQLDMTVQQ